MTCSESALSIGWPPVSRSIMLRRRWPNVTPAPSKRPEPSGPRWAIFPSMRRTSARSLRPQTPAMAHTSEPPSESERAEAVLLHNGPAGIVEDLVAAVHDGGADGTPGRPGAAVVGGVEGPAPPLRSAHPPRPPGPPL